MENWIDVAAETEIPAGEWKIVWVDDMEVMVINLNGTYYAIEDHCTHDGGVLSDGGEIEGDEIVCPRHGARFCIKSGAVTAPPAYEDIETFDVRVHAGRIEVNSNN